MIRWTEALAAKPDDLSSKPGTHSGGTEPTPESCLLVVGKCMHQFSISLSIINNNNKIIITKKKITFSNQERADFAVEQGLSDS